MIIIDITGALMAVILIIVGIVGDLGTFLSGALGIVFVVVMAFAVLIGIIHLVEWNKKVGLIIIGTCLIAFITLIYGTVRVRPETKVGIYVANEDAIITELRNRKGSSILSINNNLSPWYKIGPDGNSYCIDGLELSNEYCKVPKGSIIAYFYRWRTNDEGHYGHCYEMYFVSPETKKFSRFS